MPQQPDGAAAVATSKHAIDGPDVTAILDADATIRYVSATGQSDDLFATTLQRCERLERDHRWQLDLIATLSHELRTPLDVIIGYHDLLLDGTFGQLSSEQSYTLRRAQRSAQEVLDILSTTLDLTRLDGGGIRVVTQTIGADFFEDLGREETARSDKPGVTLEWNVSATPQRIVSDPAKLKMVIKHLVRNALQLTDSGAVTVAIRSRDDGLAIDVADAGGELSHKSLPPIIALQHPPDTSSLAGFGGSLLGLYAARRLIEILGGTVAIDISRAAGSTVSITLPPNAKFPHAA